MPYEWMPSPDPSPDPGGASGPAQGTDAARDPELARLHLWPYRSLPRRGFVLFMAVTCLLILMPMLAVLGSPVLWGLLPFFTLAVWGIWAALSRSYRDAEILEELTLSRDLLTLTRHGPRGQRRAWQTNPYWVALTLHPTGGPVPDYLTLRGDGRAVELGAFLTQSERVALHDDLSRRLARLR